MAPALAVGATVLVKPPHQAPGPTRLLAEIFETAVRAITDPQEIIPLSTLQVLNASNEVISKAVSDPRIAILSFTGSDRVGWMLRNQATHKKVALELGGNAGVIVHSDANLKRAAARCAFGGFAYAGQICISVQRIFVHEEVAQRFTELFLSEVKKLVIGDPARQETVVGPLIDQAAADRVMAWIDEATQEGAHILLGGTRQESLISPTVLSGVKSQSKLCTEEVFGPVVVLNTYREFTEAIAAVNSSRYGLQAGVFTENLKLTHQAIENLDVGGILINEIPTYRADSMPYGGMKESGLGREGVRYAMEEFSERKTVISWMGDRT